MLSGYGGGSGADREGRRGPEVESDDVSGDAAFDELPEDGAVSGASARGGIRKCARGGVLGSGTARRTCRADHDRDNASTEVGDAHARATSPDSGIEGDAERVVGRRSDGRDFVVMGGGGLHSSVERDGLPAGDGVFLDVRAGKILRGTCSGGHDLSPDGWFSAQRRLRR